MKTRIVLGGLTQPLHLLPMLRVQVDKPEGPDRAWAPRGLSGGKVFDRQSKQIPLDPDEPEEKEERHSPRSYGSRRGDTERDGEGRDAQKENRGLQKEGRPHSSLTHVSVQHRG